MSETNRDDAPGILRTPEHLDRALYVTTARAWLALCVVVALTAAAVLWAVFGELSIYVEAEGLLLSREGMVVDAASPGRGRLSRLTAMVGRRVEEGDLVAEIFDAETSERLASAVALAAQRGRILRDRASEAREENKLAGKNSARQRRRLVEMERTARELVEKSRERLKDDQKMFTQGIFSRMDVERSEQALEVAQRNLFDALRRRDQLEEEDVRRRNSLNSRVAHAKGELLQAERRVSELRALVESWRIRAPVSGRVTEIKAQVGASLSPGQPVISIETGGAGLDVLIYVPPLDGKRVDAGMHALVSPVTVRREEYGSMIGVVESISESPISRNGMVAVLQNQELARIFSLSGPPYPGRVALTPDPTTSSGVAWTSPQATTIEITPGTFARVEIRVSTKPPFSLVVPWIEEKLNH